ncbi:choline-sulfatase [Haloferula helveola]|uniref:Choline-sulfatase n=1 Tax=Haloferula helveola TaxID=490095 RepID=A0ABM7R9W6_9BACT|nr:choline-sulfatase [Haloferula helveola]
MKALLILLLAGLSAVAAEKPNVLFLFADDMTWKAVNALSDEDIDTPNLDRLAERGTTFTHAYNSGGWHGAICVASRTMLNTGLQLWNAQAAEKSLKKDYAGKKRSWSQLMSAAGYRTCISGKWHVGMPADQIFDEAVNIRPGMPRDRKNAYERPVEGKPDPWSPTDTAEGGFWQGGKHWSEVIVDDFEGFLGSDDDRPWFMYLAFNAPHDPRQAPQEFLDRYPLDRIKLPKNFLPVYPHRDPMGAPQSLRDEKLAPSPRTPFAVKTHRREYYAIITHLDEQIGKILDRLEKSPDGKNTFICFTADHGLGCGEHGLLGKQNLYDHSVRVPFIVAGPGVKAGGKIDAPIYLQDIMPTTLELAGAEVPDSVEFESLNPHIKGEGTPREFAFGAYRDLQRMIEKDGKKLILYPKAKVARVFDLKSDPHEMNDLIDTPEGKKIAAELFPVLVNELKRLGDGVDLKAVYSKL